MFSAGPFAVHTSMCLPIWKRQSMPCQMQITITFPVELHRCIPKSSAPYSPANAGMLFFILNTAFAGFIKFDTYRTAAIVLSAALGPGLLLCGWLHIRWMPHLLDNRVASPVVSQLPSG